METPIATPAETAAPEATPTETATPIATPTVRTTVSAAPTHIPFLPGFEPSAAIDQLLIGDWQCRTFAGTELTHEYSHSDDASSLLVDTQLALAGGQTATIHETYRHHLGSHTWTAILDNGAFVATTGDSSGDTWTFAGKSTENGKIPNVQMIYKTSGRDTFRRDFRREEGGIWTTYAGETCQRSR